MQCIGLKFRELFLLQITLDDLEFQSRVLEGGNLDAAIKIGAYPATVTYRIDSNYSAPCTLKCTVRITGVNKPLEYRMTSSLQSHANRGMYT